MNLLKSKTLPSENQAGDKNLEMKLKPWERDYIASLNNRLRGGSHSVTAGDSASIQKMQETMQELERNQTSKQKLSKYAAS